MSKIRDAFVKDRDLDLFAVPVADLVHDDSVLRAIRASVDRGKLFNAEEGEEVHSQDEILRLVFSSAMFIVADELELWKKTNEKLKKLVKEHPYIIEQLGEPLDLEEVMSLDEDLRGWLGDPEFLQDWQAAIMSGNGMSTIPRRPLPGEDFERIDMIDGKRGYTRGG